MFTSHPRRDMYLSLGVALSTLVLTVAFHFLLAQKPFGFSFAIFIALLVCVCHVVVILASRPTNAWAYVFLGPIAFVILAQILYANDVMRALSFPIVYASLVLFSFWLTTPRITWNELPSLWSRSLLRETVIPVDHGSGMLRSLLPGHHSRNILIGIAAALPFLFVFSLLFASADPLFSKVLTDLFRPDFETIFRLIRDVIVAIFLGRIAWAMLSRATENRHPHFWKWEPQYNRTAMTIFLGLINLLFLTFIGFQFVYFFGGVDLIQNNGLTYADYARQGFFQLLVAAGIVFLIGWGVYRLTAMRDWLTRLFMLALIIETDVVIISAVKRLVLYIDAYGLTVSRWWAMAIILFIAVILQGMLLGSLLKTTFSTMAKMFVVFTLYVFSGLLLINVEGMVVDWNADRFLSGKTEKFDFSYFEGLSSDAVPSGIAFLKKEWRFNPLIGEGGQGPAKEGEIAIMKARKATLETFESEDWRNTTVSDYRALAALGSLE